MVFMIIGCNVILFTWKIIKTNYSSYYSDEMECEAFLMLESLVSGGDDNKSANVLFLILFLKTT